MTKAYPWPESDLPKGIHGAERLIAWIYGVVSDLRSTYTIEHIEMPASYLRLLSQYQSYLGPSKNGADYLGEDSLFGVQLRVYSESDGIRLQLAPLP